MNETRHIPVLLHESIEGLDIHKGGIYVDGTLGAGGHALAIVSALENVGGGTLIGIDQDPHSLDRASQVIRDYVGTSSDSSLTFTPLLGNFRHIAILLREYGVLRVDGILLDLGYSSDQLASGYGLSFQTDESLSMALSPDTRVNAYDIVNTWSESTLADIIYGFGEETRSRRIAKAIIEARTNKPIRTTKELADLVERVIPRRGSRIHPATKTFQALRIAVNEELDVLREFLNQAIDILNPKARLAIISFHSLEDRIVKRTFKSWLDHNKVIIPYQTFIRANESERIRNPRSRSAILRIIEKI